jgi:hypothetical protein
VAGGGVSTPKVSEPVHRLVRFIAQQGHVLLTATLKKARLSRMRSATYFVSCRRPGDDESDDPVGPGEVPESDLDKDP